MKKFFSNPLNSCTALFFTGWPLAAWGLDKWESTIEARTHGAMFMMIAGCIMGVAGIAGWFIFGSQNND